MTPADLVLFAPAGACFLAAVLVYAVRARRKRRRARGGLTRAERRQFRQIERNYSLTASEPGRRR